MTLPIRPFLARHGVAALILATLWGCAGADQTLPPPPPHPNGQALWKIVHDQCLPYQRDHNLPTPCAEIKFGVDAFHSFVVLKDRVGVAQHLLMPITPITGIEDPRILAADAPNFFADAWAASGYVQSRLDQPLPRDLTSVAVNSIYGRSQDLLHLHIDCLDPAVRAALASDSAQITNRWSKPDIILKGRPWRVRWLEGDRPDLNPFRVLAEEMPGAADHMGAWTLALIGADEPGRGKGFYLVATRADPTKGERGSSEDLQDHSCKGVLAS